MGQGPRYRVPMRRRREGKTNYHRRLKMVLSGKLRLIIRTSLNSTNVQVAKANIVGDEILCSAHTKQLKKFSWNFNSGNIPSAYLTGYLCGLKAIKAGIKEGVILDMGIITHKNRVLAAFKGFIDSGVSVPFGEKIFDGSNIENRINGTHIKEYAQTLKKDDSEKYNKIFSQYINLKLDPAKIPAEFDKTKKMIEKEI